MFLISGCNTPAYENWPDCEYDYNTLEFNEDFHWPKQVTFDECNPHYDPQPHEMKEEVLVEGDEVTDRIVRHYCEVCDYSYNETIKCPRSIAEEKLVFTLSEDQTYYVIDGYDYYENGLDHAYFPVTYNGLPVKGINALDPYFLNENKKIIIPDTYTFLGKYFLSDSNPLTSGAYLHGYVYIPDSIKSIDDHAFGRYAGEVYTNYKEDEIGSLFNSLIIPHEDFNRRYGCKIVYDVSSTYEPYIVDGIEYQLDEETQTAKAISYHGDKDTVFQFHDYVDSTYQVTEIIPNAFARTTYSGYLPYYLTKIGRGAFIDANCSGTLVIPPAVKVIPEAAFLYSFGYGAMTEVSLNEGLEEIDDGAFTGEHLTGILDLPKSLARVGQGAFQDSHFEELNIYEKLESASYKSFGKVDRVSYYAKNLINESNYSMFDDCIEIYFYETVQTVPSYICYYNESLASVSFDKDIELLAIGNGAFGYCKALKSITIPSGIRYIGDYAFESSGLTGTINLPNSLYSIGDYAFTNCVDISKFTYADPMNYFEEIEGHNWNDVSVGLYNYRIPVQCSDGTLYGN